LPDRVVGRHLIEAPPVKKNHVGLHDNRDFFVKARRLRARAPPLAALRRAVVESTLSDQVTLFHATEVCPRVLLVRRLCLSPGTY
jgi:hypothetical protein